MWHRKHRYMRLDGSSKIAARRDMVADFQSRADIFVFLLSTRAGGLGINLTAADTVSTFSLIYILSYFDKAERGGVISLSKNSITLKFPFSRTLFPFYPLYPAFLRNTRKQTLKNFNESNSLNSNNLKKKTLKEFPTNGS